MLDAATIALLAATGLCAGLLGGMLGVGGSIIMIPAMVAMFGQGDRDPGYNQHLYQAAAMIVNVCVVLPALVRHARAGAIAPRALKLILPPALAFIFIGVALSNLPVFHGPDGAKWLGRLLAAFLAYVLVVNVRRLVRGRQETDGEARLTLGRASAVSATMGTLAGLMGIGGGAIAVPMQQMLMRLPLRQCIANSTAIICITAGFGAVAKNATLPPDCALGDALALAGLLAPTAIVGGYLGGALTHALPLKAVRLAFIMLLAAAVWKMAAL